MIKATVGGYPQFSLPGQSQKGYSTRGVPFFVLFTPFFDFDPVVKIGGTPLP